MMGFQKEAYMQFDDIHGSWFIGLIMDETGRTKYHYAKNKEEAKRLLEKHTKHGYKDVTPIPPLPKGKGILGEN